MWFKSYGFSQNPFSILPDPSTLVGLERERMKLVMAIESGNIFALTGYTGSGKTTLLKFLVNYCKQHDYVPVYYDCSSAPNTDFSMKKILTKPPRFFGLVKGSQLSQRDNIVFFCDEIQKLDEDRAEEIKAYFDSGLLKAVIFSTIDEANIVDSMKSRISETISLRYPPTEELAELLKKRTEKGTNPFTEGALKELVEISSNNPRIALINAEKVCKELYQTHHYPGSITPDLVRLHASQHKLVPPKLAEVKAVKGTYDAEKRKLVKKQEPNKSEVVTLKKSLSPLQWSIVTALSNSNVSMTYDELVMQIGKSKGSIAKQLSRLSLVSDVGIMERKGITKPVVFKASKQGKPSFDLVEEYRYLLTKK